MSDQENLAPTAPETTPKEIPSKLDPIVFLEEDEDLDLHYEKSLQGFHEEEIVTGKVTEITVDFVTIDIGFKSDCLIASNEFNNNEGVLQVEIGDEVEVYVEALEADEDGVTYLSKIKAEKVRTWEKIGEIYEEGGMVRGTIVARIKGGLSVDIGIKAFLPGSQVDLRPVRNLDKLIGEEFDFKILKFNQKRGNIVLSRRVLLELDRDEKRLKTLEIIKEGALITGYVKNITDYGVFVDLGGVDGLLHITDMTWGRIIHPSEMFEIGDEVEVVVLKYFPEDQKVSLGLKQKAQNPWDVVEEKYSEGTKVNGKIVSLTEYGAFIEIEPGVEGLIHVSEMSWTKKVRHPSKIVELGQMVEAVVKDLDVERKRISLSIKDVQANPWKLALDRYPVGCIVNGSVRNITDFGIFVGLDEGIDGLVHVSDISWKQRECKPSEVATKGDEIEVKVLNIDVEQERLSLGIKQLTDDPWKDLDEKNPLGSEITGKVVNLTDFGIFIEVFDGVEGLVHISEVDSTIPKNKVHEEYPIGSEVQAKVIKIDLDERRLGLSLTKIISKPEPSEKEDSESEIFLKDEKEKTDQKSLDSPEKTKEVADVSEDPILNLNNEDETATKVKKKPAKKKVVEDLKDEESIEKVEGSIKEELSIADEKPDESINETEEAQKTKQEDQTSSEPSTSIDSGGELLVNSDLEDKISDKAEEKKEDNSIQEEDQTPSDVMTSEENENSVALENSGSDLKSDKDVEENKEANLNNHDVKKTSESKSKKAN